MTRVSWLADASEGELRSALVACAPDLAGLPMRIKPRVASSDPLWWASSAVVDEAVVVKFAWSEARAVRLWREGVILERLGRADPPLPLPEVVVVAEQPALVATRIVRGVPLGGEWAWELAGADADCVGGQLAAVLARLHDLDVDRVLAGLPVVVPSPQADTARLPRSFPTLVDHERGRWGPKNGDARPERKAFAVTVAGANRRAAAAVARTLLAVRRSAGRRYLHSDDVVKVGAKPASEERGDGSSMESRRR